MRLSRLSPLVSCCAFALAAALALPAVVRASEEDNPPEMAQKTTDALEKLQPLLDAKNWDGAIDLLNTTIVGTDADSYDRAIILNTLGKLYIQKDAYAPAVDAWEQSLALADSHKNYFEPRDVLEMVLSLAQTYSQEASATKDSELQHQYFTKAAAYVKRWLESTPKPTVEAESFYASVLYQQATINEKHIDLDLVKEAQAAAIKATTMSVATPKETLYQLIYITYVQEGNLEKAAEYLEYLARQYPTKAYWPQLMAAYVNLAGMSDKDPQRQREFYLRAINAEERAQAYGKMKTPKDYYNLFTLYYTAGQFGEATDLLYQGMKTGRIDSTEKNWLNLASALIQNSQYAKAIQVLKEAEGLFPESGEIDFQIAQIYSSEIDDSNEAYKYIIPAIDKGNLEKPFNAYLYLAYLAYELEKFPDALKAAQKALTYPQGRDSKQLNNLAKAIEESINLQKQGA